jgi:hypothetical protein
MYAVRNRRTDDRKSTGERIKAWLCGNKRRTGGQHTFQPRLECLERRDVPSTMGTDAASIQADFNYLTQVYQQQAAYIQKDMTILVQDVQQGLSSQMGTDSHQLQTDFNNASQALTDAIKAIMSGQIPSATPSSSSVPGRVSDVPSSSSAPLSTQPPTLTQTLPSNTDVSSNPPLSQVLINPTTTFYPSDPFVNVNAYTAAAGATAAMNYGDYLSGGGGYDWAGLGGGF